MREKPFLLTQLQKQSPVIVSAAILCYYIRVLRETFCFQKQLLSWSRNQEEEFRRNSNPSVGGATCHCFPLLPPAKMNLPALKP